MCGLSIGCQFGSPPVSAWESYQVPVHTSHSPQHSTASSSNVSVTVTPTISPGVSADIQLLPSQQQQQQQQQVHSGNQSNTKVIRRLGTTKKPSRPFSMANVFDHHALDPSNSNNKERRGSY